MKIILKLLAILLVVTSFQSCKKKSTDETDNVDLTGKIKAIKTGNTTLIDYTYRNEGKIKEETRHMPNGKMIISYEYTDGKISSIKAKDNNGILIYQYDLTYTNNKLDKFIIVGVNNVYWKMFYNTDGTIDYTIQYTPDQNNTPQPTKKQEFTYDNQKNITEAIEYNRFGTIWEQQSRYTFEYDSKNNPQKDLQIPYSKVMNEFANLASPNNSTHIEKYDQNGALVDDTHYQYNYNADNYPTQVTENNTLTYDITYY